MEWAIGIYVAVILGGVALIIGWNVVRSIRETRAKVREMDRKRGCPPTRRTNGQDLDSITGPGIEGLF